MPKNAQYLPMEIKAKKDGPIFDLLLEEFGSASKTRIRKMLKYEMVKVGGKTISRADFAVKAGQHLEYVKKTLRDKIVQAPVPIIFEDDYLLVVEKPPGLLTYGQKGTGGTSLYRILKDFIKQRSSGRQRVYVVHRLDREVSGLVLFAKDEKIQQQIKANWKGTKKLYYALVEGRPENEGGTLRSWLKEGPGRKMTEVNKPDGAKLAVTHYRILKKLPGYTLLEIEPETGRKNQVRVHLAGLGHPLVGDRRYGAADEVLRRIRLHAFYLSFIHPVSGRFLEFSNPMPRAFLVPGNKDEVYKYSS
jgi:23S rRNA pseudouridine1911/1915/1917 synthase